MRDFLRIWSTRLIARIMDALVVSGGVFFFFSTYLSFTVSKSSLDLIHDVRMNGCFALVGDTNCHQTSEKRFRDISLFSSIFL